MAQKSSHQSSRRDFVKNISFASLFFATGKMRLLTSNEVLALRNQVKFRFAVASDAHYGQPNTPYKAMTETLLSQINATHANTPFDFTAINGDLIHNEPSFMPLFKAELDLLQMPYYVSRGNHDMVTSDYWESIWNTPLNHEVVIGDQVILIGDTSNEKGEYTRVDLNWLTTKLDQYKDVKNIFLFLHIPQQNWSKDCVDNPDFAKLVTVQKNLKAIFHGHEHNKDGVVNIGNVPCLYDSHIGGNWGLPYKGFRVVEIMKDNSMVTYMMNPTEVINKLTF